MIYVTKELPCVRGLHAVLFRNAYQMVDELSWAYVC
jgi:hypothetical protein